MDGLIHISELSWSHVNHPSEVLEIGQNVKVKVLDIDRDRQRISLGLKQTQSDPWQQVLDAYHEDDVVEGTRHQGRHLRRLRRDPARRRGARPHLRAGAAPRREPARGRLAGRRGQRHDPRGRRRAPPPLALAEAGRGGRGAAAAAGRRAVGARDAAPRALRGGLPGRLGRRRGADVAEVEAGAPRRGRASRPKPRPKPRSPRPRPKPHSSRSRSRPKPRSSRSRPKPRSSRSRPTPSPRRPSPTRRRDSEPEAAEPEPGETA